MDPHGDTLEDPQIGDIVEAAGFSELLGPDQLGKVIDERPHSLIVLGLETGTVYECDALDLGVVRRG